MVSYVSKNRVLRFRAELEKSRWFFHFLTSKCCRKRNKRNDRRVEQNKAKKWGGKIQYGMRDGNERINGAIGHKYIICSTLSGNVKAALLLIRITKRSLHLLVCFLFTKQLLVVVLLGYLGVFFFYLVSSRYLRHLFVIDTTLERKYKDLLVFILVLKRSLYFRPEW